MGIAGLQYYPAGSVSGPSRSAKVLGITHTELSEMYFGRMNVNIKAKML
jgi:hypothetical protein